MTSHAAAPVTVDIIVATFDGARWLPEFLASLRAQSHQAWRMWVRDDGSSDATVAVLRQEAAADPRIHLFPPDGQRLGATRSFARLLAALPAECEYVFCADQDDVWLPAKVERTLAAMRRAESEHAGPVLVHTDLVVVDAELRVVHPSLWGYSRVAPEPTGLRRLVVQNVATGATVLLNRALRERIGEVPEGAFFHDWWFACVAAAFGRIIALREPTVLYRQHGANAVGAAARGAVRLDELPAVARASLLRQDDFRAALERSARQAEAFLVRYGDALPAADRRFLRGYAAIPRRSFLRRKLDVARFRLRREFGVARNLAALLRA